MRLLQTPYNYMIVPALLLCTVVLFLVRGHGLYNRRGPQDVNKKTTRFRDAGSTDIHGCHYDWGIGNGRYADVGHK